MRFGIGVSDGPDWQFVWTALTKAHPTYGSRRTRYRAGVVGAALAERLVSPNNSSGCLSWTPSQRRGSR